MELVTIPEKLEEFDIKLLDKLITIPSIESENFDFKEEPSDLHEDICAMANTKGGFLILGVGQIKGKDDKTLIGFKKIGFTKGEEDPIGNKINSFRYLVDPIPYVTLNHIYEDNGSKFYTVIKIESKISEKPYFVKSTDQCFVRLHSSSQRVGRTTILNLFSASVEQVNNVEKLNVASKLVREAVINRVNDINSNPFRDETATISPIDLFILKDAILHSEWFLKEKNLLGGSKNTQEYTFGIFTILNTVEQLNAWLGSFNVGFIRGNVKSQIMNWPHGSSGSVIGLLDQIIKACEEFLSKYHSHS